MTYNVYQSELIKNNHNQFVLEINNAVAVFNKEFGNKDSTWDYRFYNAFSLTAPSLLFYNLFSELKTVIRDYAGHNKPLWMQSWINFHMPNQVLKWHDHDWPFHGYIAIDPKDTITVFENYTIKNEVGNIYIGPGKRMHTVKVLNEYDTPRITIGYDVTDQPNIPGGTFSLIPI